MGYKNYMGCVSYMSHVSYMSYVCRFVSYVNCMSFS